MRDARDATPPVMTPVQLHEVIRPTTRFATLSRRSTNPLLLTPVFGAFFQILWTHRVPSLGWAMFLLLAALATRLLKTRAIVRERPAVLGKDGLLLDGRFVAAPDLARVERAHEAVWVTTRSGERLELRVPAPEVEHAARVIDELVFALTPSGERDVAGERLLAAPSAAGVPASVGGSYRGLAFDAGRCLAIVEDAAADPAARIRAARLVASDPDEAVRFRVGEVAHATANPALREALLEGVEEEPTPSRALRADRA